MAKVVIPGWHDIGNTRVRVDQDGLIRVGTLYSQRDKMWKTVHPYKSIGRPSGTEIIRRVWQNEPVKFDTLRAGLKRGNWRLM